MPCGATIGGLSGGLVSANSGIGSVWTDTVHLVGVSLTGEIGVGETEGILTFFNFLTGVFLFGEICLGGVVVICDFVKVLGLVWEGLYILGRPLLRGEFTGVSDSGGVSSTASIVVVVVVVVCVSAPSTLTADGTSYVSPLETNTLVLASNS